MKKTDLTKLGKIAEMMPEDQYWTLIEKAKKKAEDLEDMEDILIEKLSKLAPKDIIGFQLRTDKLRCDSYTADLWCAAYLMNGGVSDDGFEYFRCWLIANGKDFFYTSTAHPDSISAVLDDDSETDDYEFEALMHVASYAFDNRTNSEIFDYIDFENFAFKEGNYPEINLTWNEENPDTLQAICPQLFEIFWADAAVS